MGAGGNGNGGVPADQLDHLRVLLRALTHELASPMTPLFGHLELLEARSGHNLTPVQTRSLVGMRRALDRLVGLNDALLEYARIERGHYPLRGEPVSARAAVGEALGRLGESATAGAVDFEAGAELELVTDRDHLVKALMRMLENALCYGGDEPVRVRAVRDNGGGSGISVVDRGTGVPESELGRLVEPFYRLAHPARARTGSGLGLTTADLISRRLGGSLELSVTESDDPEQPGLTATLRLPARLEVSG